MKAPLEWTADPRPAYLSSQSDLYFVLWPNKKDLHSVSVCYLVTIRAGLFALRGSFMKRDPKHVHQGPRNALLEADEGWLCGSSPGLSPISGHTKSPASRAETGSANPWYPLKRADIVWLVLWSLNISIPLWALWVPVREVWSIGPRLTLPGSKDSFTAGHQFIQDDKM